MNEYTLNGLPYIIQFPEDFDETKKYPILMHLHGAGTRGKMKNLYGAPPLREAKKQQLPLVTVAPLCGTDETWFDHFHQLKELVKYIAALPYVDEDRFYLTGNSMGGYGSWQLAMSIPEYFAALIPVCGGGMYWNAGRLQNLPVWAFHGGKDQTVFCEESEKMVAKINAKGGNAKLTVFPENAHNAWDDAYGNPETYQWMLAQKRTAPTTHEDEYTDAKIYG